MPGRLTAILAAALCLGGGAAEDRVWAFLVTGDPQYLAEKDVEPGRLDPFSEQAMTRALDLIRALPGREIPASAGGGRVRDRLEAILVAGDLIDSADKTGPAYEAMQKTEWRRFTADFGLAGGDGRLAWPVYEVHGNHDGPQGDTFIVRDIIARNRKRPGLSGLSPNGLHYSFDLGPLHVVALGMFPGSGDDRRPDHHYAARGSLEFLREDLAARVGKSGRPVAAFFHLHPDAPPFDWPPEDLAEFWTLLQAYQVAALFHGHTHGSPPARRIWDGTRIGPGPGPGIDVFNPDDLGSAKRDPKNPDRPSSTRHGFLYVELIDSPGKERDRLVVRSLSTTDGWTTHHWSLLSERALRLPDGN
jgi:hypothetical protein